MNRPAPHPDDLDALLQGYFHAQLPHVWPDAPMAVELARPRSPVASRGRLTLAASVAALLGFGAMLSYVPQSNAPLGASDGLGGSTAGETKLHKHIFPERQPKLPASDQ